MRKRATTNSPFAATLLNVQRVYLFLLFLVAVYVAFGSPYAALLLNRVIGPWTASAVHHDGSISHMAFDMDLPPPAFAPIYPGASVVQSSRLVSKDAPSGIGRIELAAHGSLAEVRDFYVFQLEAQGFAVEDLGTPGLNAAAAEFLGVASVLTAKRPATDDIVTVNISTEEGIVVRSRLVKVSWVKLSEWPARQPHP